MPTGKERRGTAVPTVSLFNRHGGGALLFQLGRSGNASCRWDGGNMIRHNGGGRRRDGPRPAEEPQTTHTELMNAVGGPARHGSANSGPQRKRVQPGAAAETGRPRVRGRYAKKS